MENIIINIAEDFSRFPSARYQCEGEFSGEEFRENLLVPKLTEALNKKVKLIVILDGSAGYSTSFLEESFGGLIRNNHFTLKDMSSIKLISEEDLSYIDDIKSYWRHAAEYKK